MFMSFSSSPVSNKSISSHSRSFTDTFSKQTLAENHQTIQLAKYFHSKKNEYNNFPLEAMSSHDIEHCLDLQSCLISLRFQDFCLLNKILGFLKQDLFYEQIFLLFFATAGSYFPSHLRKATVFFTKLNITIDEACDWTNAISSRFRTM